MKALLSRLKTRISLKGKFGHDFSFIEKCKVLITLTGSWLAYE